MKLVELLKGIQEKQMKLLLFDLEEKEYFSKLERAGKNGALFMIVLEQSDLESSIVSFSKEMLWEDALNKLNSIKENIQKQKGHFVYSESSIGFGYDVNGSYMYEYNIKTVKQAKNFAQNLYKAGAIDNTPPKGWIKQIRLD